MKIIITIFGIVTLSLVTFQIHVDEVSSDDIWRFFLLIGVAHLIWFQIWVIKKWRTLGPQPVTTGLWVISLINIADIAACTYAIFDLQIVYAF